MCGSRMSTWGLGLELKPYVRIQDEHIGFRVRCRMSTLCGSGIRTRGTVTIWAVLGCQLVRIQDPHKWAGFFPNRSSLHVRLVHPHMVHVKPGLTCADPRSAQVGVRTLKNGVRNGTAFNNHIWVV